MEKKPVEAPMTLQSAKDSGKTGSTAEAIKRKVEEDGGNLDVVSKARAIAEK